MLGLSPKGWLRQPLSSELRLFVRLLELLAGLAVVLASVCLYAVIAFGVAARRREFGIRMALGARKASVAALVAHHAVGVLIVGGTLGLVGVYWLFELLSSRFLAVLPTDPASWLSGVGFIVAAMAAACVIPTLRAVNVEPMETIRTD